jgi:hypothetical protein
VSEVELQAVEHAAERLRERERASEEARRNLREWVVAAFEVGESKSAIARAAGVSRQWIAQLLESR